MPVLNTTSPAIEVAAPKEYPSASMPSAKTSFPRCDGGTKTEPNCDTGDSPRLLPVEDLFLDAPDAGSVSDFRFMIIYSCKENGWLVDGRGLRV